LTGGLAGVITVTTEVEVAANNNQFWWAIPNEMLHTYHTAP
jgi:hypothetical protein